MNSVEADRRYRIVVHLKRVDRPTTWKFHCVRCRSTVGEVTNADVEYLTDLVDYSNTDNAMNGNRCDGRYFDEAIGKMKSCHIWYYWDLA